MSTRSVPHSLTFIASALVLLAAIYLNGIALIRSIKGESVPPLDSYSYLESDFPPSIVPLSEFPYDSRMIIDDTIHYMPNISDSKEWSSLFPRGDGFVRLGDKHRLFGISMYHQMHCLMKIQRAIYEEPPTDFAKWHVSHCMNYLRQMLLCGASIKLEPFRPNPIVGREMVDGLGLEHTCRDWSVLRKIAEENFDSWPEGLE